MKPPLPRMYSAARAGVNAVAPALIALSLGCDPELARLFTPLRPVLGRYEVCTTSAPLLDTARGEGQEDPVVEELEPLDAFGSAGRYDRAALARLYGGRRVRVARGWKEEGRRFESVTLLSPYPDASLTRLHEGTMVIRWILSR